MQFRLLRNSLKLCRAASIPVCITGHRGIGKSQLVESITNDGIGDIGNDGFALPMGFVDYRCSQLESSDLRGLPDKKNDKTVYLPPAEMPVGDMSAAEIHQKLLEAKENDPDQYLAIRQLYQPRYRSGILFLDELNRAHDDVLQAVFQLVLDRRIGQYVLPPGWNIVVACNYMSGDYITNGFTDPAFLDRFCHLQLIAGEGTLDEWTHFMAAKHNGYASQIIEFCASNLDMMTGSVSGDLGFSIQPSPRSWDMVAAVERVAADGQFDDNVRRNVISGLIGDSASLSYFGYTCPVQPRDILNKGVGPYRDKLEGLDRGQIMSVGWGLISHVHNRLDDVDIVDICLDFAEVLLHSDSTDKDVVVGFCRALLGSCDDGLAACLTNRDLAKSVLQLDDVGDNDLTVVRRLFERVELHRLISNAGWGIDLQTV